MWTARLERVPDSGYGCPPRRKEELPAAWRGESTTMQGEAKKLTDVGIRLGEPGLSTRAAEDCCVHLNSDSLHDLVSPVNQMRCMAELILKKYRGTLDDDAEVMFKHFQNSVQRLDDLLAGLRTYMRVVGTRGTYRRSDGNAVLASALVSIRHAIEQNVAVVSHEQLPELYCDPRQIGCAFASLIENAIKFRSEQRPEVHVSAIREGNFWAFCVRDNGIGIDPRHSERIFSVFKRVNNGAYAGSGVGLAITKQIIEQHGGRIWVESRLGSGAAFYFTLPEGECA
jgi:light-regulated signal transduction histidine kinase (bacteriophytochrome)